MKRILQKPSLLPRLILSAKQISISPPLNLTPEELKQTNLLLPRLCESNHLHEAIRLLDTILLANPPLASLSISVLIDRLSEEANMTQSMSLLNRLKHNPTCHPRLLDITKMLITSYLNKRKFKEVMKIMGWISRSCVGDEMLYRIVVEGLCRNRGLTVEALRLVKKMVEENVVVADDLRNSVYRSLLWEARITEAKELNDALAGDDPQRVIGLLDRIITDWTL